MTSCVIPACRDSASSTAPLPLCAVHLAIAGDWAGHEWGVTDTLPSPCRACGSRLGVRWPSDWLCAVCEWRFGEVPDGDVPPPRVDVVYYVQYRDRVKIGTSADPRKRLAAVVHDRVLAFERGDRHREHARHVQFSAERLERSEWFSLSERLRAHIDSLAAGNDDPWSLIARWRSEATALRG